jgi:uncharacterized protein
MFVHLEDILPEGIEIEVCVDPDDPAVRELNVNGPVVGSFEIRKMGQQILVRGSVRGEVLLTCARCLRNFTAKIREGVDIELRPVLDLERSEQERELGSDDLDVEFFRGDVLNVGHLVAEQIPLCIPMKPLCQDDCGGICPECGADRTLGTCVCEPDTDPRWSVLKDLKHQMNRKE